MRGGGGISCDSFYFPKVRRRFVGNVFCRISIFNIVWISKESICPYLTLSFPGYLHAFPIKPIFRYPYVLCDFCWNKKKDFENLLKMCETHTS